MSQDVARTPAGPGGLLDRAAPLGRRLRTEAGGAGLLLAATLAALLWANSPWGSTYDAFWHTELALRVGGAELALDLQHWVNDGLMTFFFFVIGLEVKRELVLGELADRRRAAVPAAAALVGLVVPALVYAAFTLGDEAITAWGVVISTDTAFLLGVLALLGPACPPQLRVFLLALAIADDVGALTVIALFYTEDLALLPLAGAAVGFGLMLALRGLRVWRGPAYLVVGVGAWVGMYLSGVHPTLLGVAVALATPAYAPRRAEVADAASRTRAYLQSPSPEYADAARLSIARSVPVGERLQQLWRPWTSTVMVPLFAIANAGVPLGADSLRAAAASPVTLGVVAGLVVGKLLGILLGTGLAVRLRLGDLAPGIGGLYLAGGAALSGIGFTISLFIVDLALDDDDLADQARIGVLAASVLASVLGVALLRLAARRSPAADEQLELDPPVDPGRDHVRGPVDAPLTLVEYGDFECPFCGRATGAVDELRELLGDRFRYVFRHSPLTDVHPHAQLAAEAAEAAGAQGRFWQMHDRLFASQDRLTSTDLLDHAAALDLDLVRFARELGAGRYRRRVEQDAESGRASGVGGTPTFFVHGRRHTGPTDAATLAAALLDGAGRDGGPGTGDAADGGAPDGAPDGGRTGGLPPSRVPRAGSAVDDDIAQVLAGLPEPVQETPDRGGDHPRLDDDRLARLAQHGTRRAVARGDVLYRPGAPSYDLVVVLSGTVAVIGHVEGGPPVVRVHGARRFLGELDLLGGQPVTRTTVALSSGEVLLVPLPRLRALLAEDADLRELVLRAYLVRRAVRFELATDRAPAGRGEG
ncbi:Na+/H+ antiporter NhaA [Aquipuribacter hungaricus]|uniref:Na(+)/H(+) antiporter NhaA n=1 Tax=Aquipuribacter hungaricus TaxID=545624 RepID=A0ABV7WHA9_9MICO